ncbi:MULTISPECIES: polysaccharide deacetylase family protein [Sphingomonas]|uniref:polysaccharide deacetylase family protein n=1 Tax=Sphingomonas TaxID=13687 RepID=UPI0006F723E0|nr:MULTISPECIES: polysaccharide deacetylase family protein [Sphingomonas]KQM92799.1 polysaccharide deacetylase [Sphingomonas sp. Leaf226]MDY0967532.1 polysaccharide deacetylase family protein [Sphingomonas sp. CFBP9021]USR00954.1 polysaccharide deacetylase family protein [Sphingomonas aerolata]
MSISHHGRYAYRPIVDRPDYDWPDGRRLAIYFGVNYEVFDFGGGLGPELAPAQTDPDVMNYAWRDYGNRVGAWRLFDLFDRLGLRTTALLNADVLDRCPGLAEACRDRGDEIAAHGGTNATAQGSLAHPRETQMIADVTERLATLGVRPTGWLGPWISESDITPDLLAENGYRYVLDWAHDDQPTRLATPHGGLLSIPYSQEINDLPAIIARKQEAVTFAAMIRDGVEQLLSECDRRPLVLGIALHPYIMGQAHRVPALARVLTELRAANDPRIWWTTAGDIAAHVEANGLAA